MQQGTNMSHSLPLFDYKLILFPPSLPPSFRCSMLPTTPPSTCKKWSGTCSILPWTTLISMCQWWRGARHQWDLFSRMMLSVVSTKWAGKTPLPPSLLPFLPPSAWPASSLPPLDAHPSVDNYGHTTGPGREGGEDERGKVRVKVRRRR